MRQPLARTSATSYPADAPAIVTVLMLQQQSPFVWKLDLPGRKRARGWCLWLPLGRWMWRPRLGHGPPLPPSFNMSFPCAVTVSGAQFKDGARMISLFTFRLRGGGVH